MSDEFLGDRKKALEEQFFAKENERLKEKIRAQLQQHALRQALAQASGIEDDAVLDTLISAGVKPETWAAIELIPMIEVAWADGTLEKKERAAILAAAAECKVLPGTPPYELLESFLARRPDAKLLKAWGEYVVIVLGRLDAGGRNELREKILGRAKRIASVAGGMLGLGNKISPDEQRVLDELARAFEA
jgi:hypothetical protein